MNKAISASLPAGALVFGMMLLASVALAAHNPAVVDVETVACGETTFTASITDPAGGHVSDNMRLVVHADGETQFTDPIPTDGSDVSITVGPFFTQSAETQTIQWRVFGGGERDYDSPLWNGYGDPGFAAAVSAYAAEVGSFSWVVAGPDDPNPFTTWHELEVESCELTKDMCKQGGWADLGFSNQGRCIQYVNTGKDSR